MSQPMNRAGAGAGGGVVLVVLGGVVLGSAAIVWGEAWFVALLVGGTLTGGVGDAVGAMGPLASSPGDPTAAWGDAAEGLPGPVLYWACTAVVAAVVVGLAAGIFWLWRRWSVPSRVRLGVPAEARLARRRDVTPLVVSSTVPPMGRLLLGRLSRRGPLLATEDR